MTQIHRHALVRHSATRMFELVNDVASYPRRFKWCEDSEVIESSETHMLARLNIRVAGLRTSFTTLNALEYPHRIKLALQEGPFSEFSGEWLFHALDEDACKISLTMNFEVENKLMGTALSLGFQSLADKLVDDFCREANSSDD
ncbi:MAG: type II toxin-antitoxin system RatA family toxin [Arenimonas sp.]